MTRRWLAALAALGVAGAAVAQGYRPAFRPDRLKGPPPGPPNEVMVLGTTHLSGLPATFRPALLDGLVDRLAGWRPQAIATEDLAGLQCDALRRYPRRYAETVATYCPDVAAAARATGLDVPAATARVEERLAAWPAVPTPADRRQLAAWFLAAGEPASALVQWLRLPVAERRAGDGLDAALVAELERRRTQRNESMLIAAPLAARLGLERVWGIDDHSADAPTPPAEATAYAAAIGKAWDNPITKRRQAEDKRLTAGMTDGAGVLALYRAYNAAGVADLAYQSDFGAAFVEPSLQRYGRAYLGWWETRNLRMVANLRDVLAQRPGTRLLAIVGASHKGYYEAYLNQMHDVALVDVRPWLR